MDENQAIETAKNVLRQALADGKLIEVGWQSARKFLVPAETSDPELLNLMRIVFMAGAQHIWTSMSALDREDEEADAMFAKVNAEMDEVAKQLIAQGTKVSKGRASKTRILLLDPEAQERIAMAIKEAYAQPVDAEFMRKMTEAIDQQKVSGRGGLVQMEPEVRAKIGRPPGLRFVEIHDGYCCNFSVQSQPAGMYRSLSVAVRSDNPKSVPGEEAVALLAKAFGFRNFPPDQGEGGYYWDEFEPGRRAIVLVERWVPFQQEGHA